MDDDKEPLDFNKPEDLKQGMGILSAAASTAADTVERYYAEQKVKNQTVGLLTRYLRAAAAGAFESSQSETPTDTIRAKFLGSSGTGSTRRGAVKLAYGVTGLLAQYDPPPFMPAGEESDPTGTLSKIGMEKLHNQLGLGLVVLDHSLPASGEDGGKNFRPDIKLGTPLSRSLATILNKHGVKKLDQYDCDGPEVMSRLTGVARRERNAGPEVG